MKFFTLLAATLATVYISTILADVAFAPQLLLGSIGFAAALTLTLE